MNTNSLCPSCRSVIPPDAPGGICPACALMGVAQPTVIMPFAAMPTREEVARAFPDLEILEVLGQGGMGIVFKARQPRLDRLVALKILPPALAQQPGFAERFTREARALAKLNHPNIVTVHDFGTSGGYFYLLMEHVNGVNLRKAMQAGIKPEQAMLLVPRICEALQFAHDHGVLHRDIKPENILLDTAGIPKLADFGIAKLAGDNASGLTLSGAALGTAAYMAPEQIEKPATVDHRADIYSLGVVFYEMLTGELPLGRFSLPSEKAKVAPGVDEVVMRALEKERSRRQQSATEMRTQVEGVRTGVSPAVTVVAPAEEPPSAVSHFLGKLTALSAIGIPMSAVIPGMRHLGITPQVMVFVTVMLAILTGLSRPPGARGGHARRQRRALRQNPHESISSRCLFGLPLYHFASGLDLTTGRLRMARGVLAVGPEASGFLAIGGRAHGVIAIGGRATGIVAVGGVAVGVLALGGVAIGLLAAQGGVALGAIARGGVAAGYDANGGVAIGHVAKGGHTILDGTGPDPFAVPVAEFLRRAATFAGWAVGILLAATGFFALFAPREDLPPKAALAGAGVAGRTLPLVTVLGALAAAAIFPGSGWSLDSLWPTSGTLLSATRTQTNRSATEMVIEWRITSDRRGVLKTEFNAPQPGTLLKHSGVAPWSVPLKIRVTPANSGKSCALEITLPGAANRSVLDTTVETSYERVCNELAGQMSMSPQKLTAGSFGKWITIASISDTPLRIALQEDPAHPGTIPPPAPEAPAAPSTPSVAPAQGEVP